MWKLTDGRHLPAAYHTCGRVSGVDPAVDHSQGALRCTTGLEVICLWQCEWQLVLWHCNRRAVTSLCNNSTAKSQRKETEATHKSNVSVDALAPKM